MIKVLIMGLPGSGKTTLAVDLVNSLMPYAVWINADEVRSMYNDWDFSIEGRVRQSVRMRELANQSNSEVVVCDFVAPLKEMRDVFNPDILIWMDTISESRFNDTNSIFTKPDHCDFHITEKNSKFWSEKITDFIKTKSVIYAVK